MPEEDPLTELVGFLQPNTRLDIRRAALDHVLGVSAALDGSASKYYMQDDFKLGNALTSLCVATVSDRGPCLACLTNFASGSAGVADHILHKEEVLLKAWEACKHNEQWASYGARLLANVSRHFPDRTQNILEKFEPEIIQKILDILLMLTKDKKKDSKTHKYVGFIMINLTTLPRVRRKLVELDLLQNIYPLLSQKDDPGVREVGADVLRNICFEDSLHVKLLDDPRDDFLVALVSPLADVGDDLDEEDTAKLPIRLQYYEGERETNLEVRQKLIEGLYQLCATKTGRVTLRNKGIYPILRELDKSTEEKPDPNAPLPKMKSMTLLAQETHTLHSVIGMLIRYEEELGIDPDVESLRHLE